MQEIINMNPELFRFTIQTIHDVIPVQAIIAARFKTVECLTYDHSLNPDIVENIDSLTAQNHLFALIYEISEVGSSAILFKRLEGLLKEGDYYKIGIFHEPVSNFCNLYLMAHKNQSPGLGSYFKGSKLAIFQFTYQELFGTNYENYLLYIQAFMSTKLKSKYTHLALNNKIELVNSKIIQLKSQIAHFSNKSAKIKSKIVTAKKNIIKMSKCTGEDVVDNKYNCFICKNNHKKIMFLPCGELLLCKECLNHGIKIPINVVLKKKKHRCPKCNEIIIQAVEVIF